MIVLTVILAALAALLILKLRKRREETTGWRIMWSPGMPARPTPQGSAWYFDFPTDPASHVHYVTDFDRRGLVGASRLVARFAVTGSGWVPQEAPDQTALVSMIIQRRGDDWSARGPMEMYRFYSRDVVALAAGEFTLSVPLDVSEWGGVMGGQDAGAFAAALRDVDSVGLVFGSAGGRGHGIWAAAASRFTLLEFRVS